ncbi:MAG: hypothetical protein WC091_16960 [Sulfuricellaceae bacterium]
MLQTIEVEIDPSGRIHPLEPLSFVPSGRAYLTLLPASDKQSSLESGSAAQALKLLASPRFVQRPAANPVEVQQRIDDLRNDWGSR